MIIWAHAEGSVAEVGVVRTERGLRDLSRSAFSAESIWPARYHPVGSARRGRGCPGALRSEATKPVNV